MICPSDPESALGAPALQRNLPARSSWGCAAASITTTGRSAEGSAPMLGLSQTCADQQRCLGEADGPRRPSSGGNERRDRASSFPAATSGLPSLTSRWRWYGTGALTSHRSPDPDSMPSRASRRAAEVGHSSRDFCVGSVTSWTLRSTRLRQRRGH